MLRSNKIKRNEACGCNSGKKLKNCCMRKMRRIHEGLESGKSADQTLTEELFRHKEKS